MELQERVTLSELAGGRLEESFQVEVQKVLENILDPNTDPEAGRGITITIKLRPKRNALGGRPAEVDMAIAVTSKLAHSQGNATTVWFGRKGGRIAAMEAAPQPNLFDDPNAAGPTHSIDGGKQ